MLRRFQKPNICGRGQLAFFRQVIRCCGPILALLFSAVPVFADLKGFSGAETAPNIVELLIQDEGITVQLELFPGDLKHFSDLLPDRMLRTVPDDRPNRAERLRRFSRENLTIQSTQGGFLVAELKLLELRTRKSRYSPNAGRINPTTGQLYPQPPADDRVVYVELFYPYKSGRPDVVEVSPPLDGNGVPIATIGFLTHHHKVKVNDFRFLTRPETLNLNWNDSWYSRFENPALKRHYSDAMMSFLYIEPREVRHEMLLRIRDLGSWIDLDRKQTISVEDQTRLKLEISEFAASKSPVRIDGVLTPPDDVSVEFVAIEPQGITIIENERPLDLQTAMVGVILSSPVEALPQTVSVEWELFTNNQSRIFTNTIDPAGPFNGFVEPDDPVIQWENHLKTFEEAKIHAIALGPERTLNLPVVTLGLLLVSLIAGTILVRVKQPGLAVKTILLVATVTLTASSLRMGWVPIQNPLAKIPDYTSAHTITGQLISNLHSALQEPAAVQRANALSISVSEMKYAEITNEIERGLAIEMQGGRLAKVDEILDLELSHLRPLSKSNGYQATTHWTIKASGNHWGHPHRKSIRFTALMDIEPVDGKWKLTGITVTNAQIMSRI